MGQETGDLIHACEKLSLAVHILASTHGTLQDRLRTAWMHEGRLALSLDGDEGSLPMSDDLIRKLEAYDRRMSSHESLKDPEASETARDFLSIERQARDELEELTYGR